MSLRIIGRVMWLAGFIFTHADKMNSYLDCFHLTGEIVNQTELSGSTVLRTMRGNKLVE